MTGPQSTLFGSNGLASRLIATSFQVSQQVTLDELYLYMTSSTGATTQVTVEIHVGQPDGVVIDHWLASVPTNTFIIFLSSSVYPTLAPGTTYWIVASAAGSESTWWYTGSVNQWTTEQSVNGSPWTPISVAPYYGISVMTGPVARYILPQTGRTGPTAKWTLKSAD